MSDEPQRQYDIGDTIEATGGTLVVIGVQEVTKTDGTHKQFNYIVTSPENLIAEEEETTDESDN